MGLPQEVLDVLTTPIYVERYVNKDSFGNPIYGPSERVMAVVSTHTRRRGSPGGADTIGTRIEVVSRVLVDYGAWSPYDRVTTPDNRKPTVISVDTTNDPEGNPFFQQFILEENRK